MTTDTTELALITKIKNQLKNFDTVVLKEGEALALVEALEKARAKNALVAGGIEDTAKLHERIAELESRAVKMPEPFKLAKSSSGLTYYYADEVNEALSAAGIKWEAE